MDHLIRNAERIEPLLADGTITPALGTGVADIGEKSVRLTGPEGEQTIPNDYVFVFAGGEPPFAFLRAAGVTFGGDAGAAAKAPETASALLPPASSKAT